MRKKFIIISMCLIIGIVAFGFISTPTFNDDYIYNGNSNMFVFDDEKYTYIVADEMIINKSTKEKFNFNIDVFNSDKQRPIYSDGINIFYITEDDTGYSLNYYDRSFNSHILLNSKHKSKLSNEYIESFFSKDAYLEMAEDHKTHPNQFVVLGRNVYICCNGGIFRYNLITKSKTKIVDLEIGNYNFSYSNGKLYFTDSLYNVYSYNINSKELNDLTLSAFEIRVNNNGILFADLNNNMALSFYNFETKKVCELVSKEISAWDLDDEYAYYIDNGIYYKIDLKGNNKAIIHKGKSAPIFRAGVNKYYIGYDGSDSVVIEEVSINE